MKTEYVIQYQDAGGQWSAGGPMWRTRDPVAALDALRSDPGRYRVRRARYGRRDLTEADLVQVAGGETAMDRLDPWGQNTTAVAWHEDDTSVYPQEATVHRDQASVLAHGHTTVETRRRHHEGVWRYLVDLNPER